MSPEQAKVITECAKQLGCWPLDYVVEKPDAEDAVRVVFGRMKGRERSMVIAVDGSTHAR